LVLREGSRTCAKNDGKEKMPRVTLQDGEAKTKGRQRNRGNVGIGDRKVLKREANKAGPQRAMNLLGGVNLEKKEGGKGGALREN